MRNRWATAGVLFLAALVAAPAVAQQEENKASCCQRGKNTAAAADAQGDKLKPQTVCPIMGGKIDKEVFVDVAGYRIYACCPSCLAKIKADPEKAVATLKAKGEKPELRLAVCPECGEIKGTAQCCKPDAKKCSNCGLNKGSIGCCKELKPLAGQKDIVLCAGCGDVKGSAKCCKPNATKLLVPGVVVPKAFIGPTCGNRGRPEPSSSLPSASQLLAETNRWVGRWPPLPAFSRM